MSDKSIGQSIEFYTDKKDEGSFPIVSNTTPTTIYTYIKADWLVQKAASLL